jgi:uncharacterized protein YpmB
MRIWPFLQYIKRSDDMKKWIIGFSIVFISIIAYVIYVYVYAMNSKMPNEADAIEQAKTKANITEVYSTSYYNGTCSEEEKNCSGDTNAYTVITGIDKDEKEIIVFVPEQEGEVVTVEKEAGLTEEEALAKVHSKSNPAEIKSIRLGIDVTGTIVWEIKYINTEGGLVYYQMDFKNERPADKEGIYSLG